MMGIRFHVAGAIFVLLLPIASAFGQSSAPAVTEEISTVALPERDGVLPPDRAWEFLHYRVRVWICSDGSALASDIIDWLAEEIKIRSLGLDESAWELLINPAPNPWNYRGARDIAHPERLTELVNAPELTHDDKLIFVCLSETGMGLKVRVREYDILTAQWGALLEQDLVQVDHAAAAIFELIRMAFMPVARVDRVTDDDFAVLRLRGVNSCLRVRLNDRNEWVVEPNESSPVFIRPDDSFLPILRRTDNRSQIQSLAPIPYTFLTIVDPSQTPEAEFFVSDETVPGEGGPGEFDLEGSFLRSASRAMLWTKINSHARAVLSGRTSKRLQKLALVIRPPTGSTTLRIVSRDKQRQPMEGVEVFMRPLDPSIDVQPEFIGKTDWQGLIEIPPRDTGAQRVLVRRGWRGLLRLPVMPGLYPILEADIPNDEARLNAEGVINGLSSEILDLVAQRKAFEAMLTVAVERKNLEEARRILARYQQLPLPQQIRGRMTEEETRLIAQAKTSSESDFIKGMFDALRRVMSTKVSDSNEIELRQKVMNLENELQSAPRSTAPN